MALRMYIQRGTASNVCNTNETVETTNRGLDISASWLEIPGSCWCRSRRVRSLRARVPASPQIHLTSRLMFSPVAVWVST